MGKRELYNQLQVSGCMKKWNSRKVPKLLSTMKQKVIFISSKECLACTRV